jgi:hypothetical protein
MEWMCFYFCCHGVDVLVILITMEWMCWLFCLLWSEYFHYTGDNRVSILQQFTGFTFAGRQVSFAL